MFFDARRFRATYATQGYDGNVTVLRAPGPITPDPAADPSSSIEGKPLALVYKAPPDLPASTVSRSFDRVTLLSTPNRPSRRTPSPLESRAAPRRSQTKPAIRAGCNRRLKTLARRRPCSDLRHRPSR